MTLLTDIKSSVISAAGAGLTVYATKEDLPSSGLTSGDQAYVTANSRLYVSNGSGWYNVALINATPSLSIDPTGTIVLSTTGETTTITLTATDSDNAVAGLTYTVESDGSFGGLATVSQDSSVFTITPLSEDSATTTSAVLTFKASDGINFGSGTRTLTLSFKVQYSNYTTALLKADTAGTDNQVDASTNAHTITEAGNTVSTAFTPYHPGGYSMYFDGTNDYVGVAYNQSIVDWASGDWTCEYWMWAEDIDNWNYVSGGNENPSSVGHGAHNAVTNYWSFGPLAGGEVRFYYYNGSPVYTATTSSGLVSSQTWHHLAAVHSSGTLKIYVDGTLATTHSVSGTPQYDAGYGLPIGSINSRYIDGYIRDLRIVNAAVYTDTFTPPTAPLTAITNTQVLLGHKPYILDGSGNDHSLTISGTSIKRFGPYDYISYSKSDHAGSVYFDGTGDYLSATHDTTLKVASEDFTYEFWWYPTVSQNSKQIAGDMVIISYPSNCNGWDLILDASGNLYARWGAPSYQDFATSTPPVYNTWNHVVLTRNSTTMAIFLNGKRIGSDTASITFTASTSANFYVGWAGQQTGSTLPPIEGYVTDARLVKGTAIYDPDSTTLTVPTAPLSAVTNTQLLTATNKNDIWDGAVGTILTKNGNATSSNTQRKFATSSAVYLDGTGDFISAPTSQVFDLAGSIAWTIEGWFYWNNLTGEQTLIEKFTGGTGPGWTLYKLNSSNALGFYSGSSSTFSNAIGTVSSGQWHHVAVTRDAAGTTRGFLDGTLNASGTYSIGNNSTGNLYIGARNGGANYMNGYVQDVRITKGLARYTTSFTPPTAEFDG